MTDLQLAALAALSCTALLALFGRAPYRDEFRTLLRRVIALLLWLAVLTIIVFLPAANLEAGETLDTESIWFPGLFIGHLMLVCFLAAWWRLRNGVGLCSFLGFAHDASLGDRVLRGLFIGIAGWGLTIAVTGLAVGGMSDSASEVHAELPEIMVWLATLPFTSKLMIVLAAMTVEEAFFRGFLQPRIGIVASSVFFALSHFNYGLPFLVVGVFTISLVLGVTFARTRDLLTCMIVHGVFDGVQLFVVLPWAVRAFAKMA